MHGFCGNPKAVKPALGTRGVCCAGLVVVGDGEGSGATLDIVQAIYAETTSTNSQKDTARI